MEISGKIYIYMYIIYFIYLHKNIYLLLYIYYIYIYQKYKSAKFGWCHTVIKFHLHYLTVTLLNDSVELSSNSDKPVP